MAIAPFSIYGGEEEEEALEAVKETETERKWHMRINGLKLTKAELKTQDEKRTKAFRRPYQHNGPKDHSGTLLCLSTTRDKHKIEDITLELLLAL